MEKRVLIIFKRDLISVPRWIVSHESLCVCKHISNVSNTLATQYQQISINLGLRLHGLMSACASVKRDLISVKIDLINVKRDQISVKRDRVKRDLINVLRQLAS